MGPFTADMARSLMTGRFEAGANDEGPLDEDATSAHQQLPLHAAPTAATVLPDSAAALCASDVPCSSKSSRKRNSGSVRSLSEHAAQATAAALAACTASSSSEGVLSGMRPSSWPV